MQTPYQPRIAVYRFTRRIIFLLLLFLSQVLFAQEKPVRDSLPTYYQKIKFIVHAPDLLPKLVAEQQWEKLKNFLTNWGNDENCSRELVFALETLLSIQDDSPEQTGAPCDALLYLSDYATELNKTTTRDPVFRYLVEVGENRRYDATNYASSILLYIRSWAKKLMQTKHLDTTSLFLCRVFAGEIADPVQYYQSHNNAYPALAKMQQALAIAGQQYFTARRDGRAALAAITAGIWVPNSHLMVLGMHPSIGAQLGVRNKLNEYDIVIAARFAHAANDYQVLRSDSLVTRNYYEGGYMGFEYTRYFIHHQYLDAGIFSGMGYDFFSIVDDTESKNSDIDYSPRAIGSFNCNGGVRIKYFFRRNNFLGLALKYNLVHYSNPGGSNLTGNAFSVDLVYGSH